MPIGSRQGLCCERTHEGRGEVALGEGGTRQSVRDCERHAWEAEAVGVCT